MRWFAVSLAVAAMALVSSAASGRATSQPPQTAAFFTPGRLAICKVFPVLNLGGFDSPPGLYCSRTRHAVTALLQGRGRPVVWHKPISMSFYESGLDTWLLRYGESWWGNERWEEGTGRSRGRVLFRCTNRESGLTCRNRSGRGFWLGRTRGYRVF